MAAKTSLRDLTRRRAVFLHSSKNKAVLQVFSLPHGAHKEKLAKNCENDNDDENQFHIIVSQRQGITMGRYLWKSCPRQCCQVPKFFSGQYIQKIGQYWKSSANVTKKSMQRQPNGQIEMKLNLVFVSECLSGLLKNKLFYKNFLRPLFCHFW